MATHHTENETSTQPKENNTLKTIGALGGIVVLLALLFIGVSQSQPAGAELITDVEKPDEATYESEASELDFEKAKLKEYTSGKLIELEGKIHKQFEEPQKGEAAVLLTINNQSSAAAGVESHQIMLIFLEEPDKIEEHAEAHVFGRYIGTLEYETAMGTDKEVPAIQVDYFSVGS